MVFLLFYFFSNFQETKEKERIYDFSADFRTLEKFGLPFYQLQNFLKKADRPENLKISESFIAREGKDKKYNLIFIQVESLDTSIIMEKYKEEPVMPYLYKLKDQSIFYPYVISYHYGGGTSDCEFSIFNSLEPLFDFPSIKLLNYDYRNSFLKILREEGYKIKAFHGNEGKFWNRSYAFPAMGFEEFYDIKKMGLKMKGWGASDEEVFGFMLDKLKLEKKPFFYFIITMSSHMPFTNVKNYFNDKKFEGLENRVLRNYFSSMCYVDGVLEKYVEEFLKIPDTYIFIYGDHVGIYRENGFEGGFLEMEGLKIEFVPLIVLTPERKVYKEEKFVVSFLDFAPTALFSSGVSFKYFTEGQNLLDFPIKNTKISPFFKKFDRQEL
ncbi:MAG: LTA synthase family protein, partial [Thermoanaerobaculia bacterium]